MNLTPKEQDILDCGIRTLRVENYIDMRQMILVLRVWSRAFGRKKRFSRAEIRRLCK